ncbi:MAG: sigma-70 family RNA polymerase sigma factor [Planctomycetota bacterium]|jgi:RNA polymerase sigma-70 factor (ECF subfamily)
MSSDYQADTEGLARKALVGDPEAFAELVQRLRGRLRMWITLRMGPLLRSRLTEDDVFQETLLQAHRSLGSFQDNGPGSFQRWIFSVAENRLRDLHKYHAAQKRDPAREVRATPRDDRERDLLQVLSTGGPTPSSCAHRSDLAERLTGSIESLEAPLRDVLIMRAIEERNFKNIAATLELSPATVRGLYARALTQLAEKMEQ